MKVSYLIRKSPLGLVLVAHTDDGLCSVMLGDEEGSLEAELRGRFPRAEIVHEPRSETGSEYAEQVLSQISSQAPQLMPRLASGGTAFQQAVWDALREIPAGSTASYTDLARRIGRPRSVRAVAGACAANRIAIVIPCHRAVRSNGDLSGYRWGVERKRALLALEGARLTAASR